MMKDAPSWLSMQKQNQVNLALHNKIQYWGTSYMSNNYYTTKMKLEITVVTVVERQTKITEENIELSSSNIS